VEPEQQAQAGEWVSIDEAAQRFHIATATVRRRLKRGELRGQQVSTAYGFRWDVWVDSRIDDEGPSTPRVDGERDDLIRDMNNQLVALAARNGWLEAQLQAAQARIELLEAPKVVEAEETPVPRPWWRWWRW